MKKTIIRCLWFVLFISISTATISWYLGQQIKAQAHEHIEPVFQKVLTIIEKQLNKTHSEIKLQQLDYTSGIFNSTGSYLVLDANQNHLFKFNLHFSHGPWLMKSKHQFKFGILGFELEPIFTDVERQQLDPVFGKNINPMLISGLVNFDQSMLFTLHLNPLHASIDQGFLELTSDLIELIILFPINYQDANAVFSIDWKIPALTMKYGNSLFLNLNTLIFHSKGILKPHYLSLDTNPNSATLSIQSLDIKGEEVSLKADQILANGQAQLNDQHRLDLHYDGKFNALSVNQIPFNQHQFSIDVDQILYSPIMESLRDQNASFSTDEILNILSLSLQNAKINLSIKGKADQENGQFSAALVLNDPLILTDISNIASSWMTLFQNGNIQLDASDLYLTHIIQNIAQANKIRSTISTNQIASALTQFKELFEPSGFFQNNPNRFISDIQFDSQKIIFNHQTKYTIDSIQLKIKELSGSLILIMLKTFI